MIRAATGEATTDAAFNLDDLVDGQRFGTGSALILLVATFALISDGFDLSAMGYVAPELAKLWHLAPARFVPAFSAGIIGLFIGAPLLGWLGDRFGRKGVIVAGLAAIGIVTLATTAVTGTGQLVVLRFLTGVGLGGVIPNVVALIAEIAPRRVRGRMVVVIALGIVVGIGLPGVTAATLVPAYGWRALLVVGGVLPLVIALAAAVVLPESLKFLAQRSDRAVATLRLARRLRPDLVIPDTARFILLRGAASEARGSARRLFFGDLAVVTPLLWLCQATNQMANFFALTWLPTLLQSAGSTTAQAGLNAALFSLGGLATGIVLLFIIDSVGVVPLVLMFGVGAPLIAAIGIPGLSPVLHGVVIAGAGACVVGVQLGITALLGIFYPTPVRAIGTGWTQAIGRIGAIAAPIVGGVLLDAHLTIAEVVLAPAIVLVVGAVASVALAVICRRRFGGLHPAEFPIDI